MLEVADSLINQLTQQSISNSADNLSVANKKLKVERIITGFKSERYFVWKEPKGLKQMQHCVPALKFVIVRLLPCCAVLAAL